MITKFFKYGQGDSSSCFNYLLNKKRVNDRTARVLQGSPAITKSICKSLSTKQRYKSGCLSFEELNIKEKDKYEIMDLFEQVIFAGLPRDSYNITWVEHTDKSRLELNFVIPRVELVTGKAYNPYFHRTDVKKLSLFRDYINLQYKLSNPMDKNKEQSLRLGDLVKMKKTDHLKRLDAYIQKQVKQNRIQNQSDVVNELENLGYEISRVGKDYISVKTKNTKAIRLKGRVYSKDWSNTNEVNNTPLKTVFKQLQEEISKSAQYNRDKYFGGLNIEDQSNKKESKKVATHSNSFTL